MDLQSQKIELPANTQILLAQSHFIKTVEDVSECLVTCVPTIKYGVAFCEASGPFLCDKTSAIISLILHFHRDRRIKHVLPLLNQLVKRIG